MDEFTVTKKLSERDFLNHIGESLAQTSMWMTPFRVMERDEIARFGEDGIRDLVTQAMSQMNTDTDDALHETVAKIVSTAMVRMQLLVTSMTLLDQDGESHLEPHLPTADEQDIAEAYTALMAEVKRRAEEGGCGNPNHDHSANVESEREVRMGQYL